MKQNILYTIAGVAVGFFIGFFIANSVVTQPLSSNGSAASARSVEQVRPGDKLPPGHPDLNSAGGSAAATSAQAQTAMDEADRNPKDFGAQMRAAAIFYELESFDKAALYLDRALALKPDDPNALTGMGHTKYDTGDYVGAAKYYEKVLAIEPKDAEVRTDLGNTYFRRTPPDYTKAIAEYRKALEIDPNSEQALEKLAAAALKRGDKATARGAIERLALVNPSNGSLGTLRSGL